LSKKAVAQCCDFLNIFAEQRGENIGVLTQKTAKVGKN
jgi:hypothetical protein